VGKRIPTGVGVSNGLQTCHFDIYDLRNSILYPCKLNILPQMIFQFSHILKIMKICRESYSTLYHILAGKGVRRVCHVKKSTFTTWSWTVSYLIFFEYDCMSHFVFHRWELSLKEIYREQDVHWL